MAFELELSWKGRRTRRDRILMGYAVDSRIDAVAYLTDNASVARSVRASAARLGVCDRVHVHWARRPEAERRADPNAAAHRARNHLSVDRGRADSDGRAP